MGRVSLRVIPGSSVVEVKIVGDEIKVKLHAKPEGGKANKELIELISKKLRIPRSNIKIVKGFSSRKKVLDIEGLTEEEILEGLLK